jgi:methylated-DNA-[protein]-cysteine S-methyltransferase
MDNNRSIERSFTRAMPESVVIDTPIGPVGLRADANGLTEITFLAPGAAGARPRAGLLGEATRQLDAYFKRRLERFDLPLAPRGTSFQLEVWQALQRIPYGDTWSYADLARRIGRPDAVRAVGAANGRNPIPIVIPCHRVIGSNGQLVGFGGGLPIKRWLLNLESNRLF